jgi:hypothetical protein
LSLKIALDGISEVQMNQIKQKWLDKKIHPLIFDECPFKAYYAKVSNSSIRFTCLDDGKGQRIYYGTGNLDFVCNYPYALGLYKDSVEFLEAYPGRYDLIEGGVLPPANGIYNIWNSGEFNEQWVSFFTINNTGDLEMDFKIQFAFPEDKDKMEYNITMSFGTDRTKDFQLSFNVKKKGEDAYVEYNSKLQNLIGLDKNKKPSGNFYQFTETNTKKIPVGAVGFIFPSDTDTSKITIEYNYVYY